MNLAAPPDANRLIYRIRTALTGESNGLDMAKLAWLFAATIERANEALKAAAALAERGQLVDCLWMDRSFPNLLDTAKALDFDQVDAWRLRCQTYGWRVPQPVDTEAVAAIAAAIAQCDDLKDWLYSQYRAAIRSKDEAAAYQLAVLLCHRFPDEASALEERLRLQGELLEKAAAEMRAAQEELIPAASPIEIAERYLLIGLPLTDSQAEVVAQTLAARSAALAAAATKKTVAAAEAGQAALESGDDWREREIPYLALDYELSTTGLWAEIDPAARTQFEAFGTALSRLRNSYEAEITLRKAIVDLKGAAKTGGSKRLADRLEKLRSLERQTLRTSGQIPQELQDELKASYALARRKKLPRAAALGAAAAIALGAGSFLFSTYQERSNSQAADQNALAALKGAWEARAAQQVAESLDRHRATIAAAAPDSALAQRAEALAAWLSVQLSLQIEYERHAKQIAELVQTDRPLAMQQAARDLFEQAAQTRLELADDIAGETDRRIQALNADWVAAVEAARQQREERLLAARSELGAAARNAANAKSRAEFDQLAEIAEARLQGAETLLVGESASPRTQELRSLMQSTRDDLHRLAARWSAHDAERLRLANATQLNSYIESLERLHAFDILPAEHKTAIEQSLRLKSAFFALKRRMLLPAGAWSEPVPLADQPPGQTRAELDDAERAFLARQTQVTAFENVYRSTVQYFEGGTSPQSEYTICLVAPIQKINTDARATDINFNFRIHGFDEMGYPEKRAREMQFISRPDGSFWGFFYLPSELSAESRFYRDTIAPTIEALPTGRNRFGLIELIDQLERNNELAPAFRAYWQQQLLEFMSLNPWKWGLALTPALQAKAERMKGIADGAISPQLWLSVIEQTVPSPEFARLFDPAATELALKEARALETLYANAMAGDFALAGFVRENGSLDLADGVARTEKLWSVNTLTGRVERIDETTELAPFAPLLRYRFENGGPEALMRKTQFATGLDLSQPSYASLLPPLFH